MQTKKILTHIEKTAMSYHLNVLSLEGDYQF
jgi:hypothetical protein